MDKEIKELLENTPQDFNPAEKAALVLIKLHLLVIHDLLVKIPGMTEDEFRREFNDLFDRNLGGIPPEITVHIDRIYGFVMNPKSFGTPT